jgi:erythromycin esterase-like protein
MKQGQSDPKHSHGSNQEPVSDLSQLSNGNSSSRNCWSTPQVQLLNETTYEGYPGYEETVQGPRNSQSNVARLTQSDADALSSELKESVASKKEYIIPEGNQPPIKEWVKAVLDYVFSAGKGDELRVVGFGEDGHGTAEHFELQAEAAKYMIEHQRAAIVAFEVSPFLAMAMNNVLQPGGDPQQIQAIVKESEALVWNNKGIVDLLTWIHSWNREHPNQTVEVMGISPKLSAEYFKTPKNFFTALQISDTSITQKFKTLLSDLLELEKKIQEAQRNNHLTSQPKLRNNLKSQLSKLQGQVAGQIKAQGTSSPGEGVKLGQILEHTQNALTFLLSMLDVQNGDNYPSRKCRDQLMAQRVIDIEERLDPEARIVVLAHNMHIAKKEGESICYPDGIPVNSEPNQHALDEFGSHLARKYGPGYCAFLSTTVEGSVRNWDGASRRCEAPSQSLEAVFEKTGFGSLFLDVRATQSKSEWQHLHKSMSMRSRGWGPAIKNDFAPALVPAKTMDGVFHFKETTASEFLRP